MKKMHPIVNNYISNPHETILLQPRDAIKKSELGQKVSRAFSIILIKEIFILIKSQKTNIF